MAAGEVFILEDTGSATSVSHTVEADVSLSGTPTAQGDWSGQYSAPELTLPNDMFLIAGYSDFLRTSGGSREGSLCQFSLNTGGGHSNVGIFGVTSWGYNRNAGGALESSRHGIYTANLSSGDIIKVRQATQLNGSDRVGSYNRTAGDPRGLWAVDLGTNRDYLQCSITATDVGSGRYRNTPRPIDLGTPSALSAGTWKQVTWDTTDDSQGTTITRSGSTVTVAANSIVLVNINYQILGVSDRNSLIMQILKDGSPYAYSSVYNRNTSSDEVVGSITIPVVTGGTSEDITFFFVDQSEDTGVGEVDVQDASATFIDLTDQDICLLGKTDADLTNIIATTQKVSFPTADEIQVDSSFDHPAANLTRITNNTGGEITVLAGYTVFCDNSATSSGTRKTPGSYISQNGTQLDYAIASEYSRGAQSGDDTFVAGYSYCAPVVMSASDYIELDLYDLAGNAAVNLIVNCTDDAAIYFWAIRIDNLDAVPFKSQIITTIFS